MIHHFDIVNIINLVLSLAILVVGCLGYSLKKDKNAFHIGVAFGLFSVSHMITFFRMERSFETTMILIRIFGYLIILFTLHQMEFKK